MSENHAQSVRVEVSGEWTRAKGPLILFPTCDV